MSSYLEKAHEYNKIMLRKIAEVCREHDITFYLDSGTLLGAVRHKSFIPWDDDVDIFIPRKDYEKLISLPKEVWGEDFEIVSPTELVKEGFFDFVTRILYMKETLPVKTFEKSKSKVWEKYQDRIGIDCFIMDDAYENALRQKLHTLHLTMIYGQAMAHRDFINYKEYGFAAKCVIFILSKIGKFKSVPKMVAKYDKVSQSANGKKSTKVYGSNYLMTEIGITYEKEWYANPTPVEIDNEFYDAPNGYDEVLTMMYGDYMQLPPEAERVPIHIDEE